MVLVAAMYNNTSGDEDYQILCDASLCESYKISQRYGVPLVSKFITDGNLENTGNL